MRDRTEGDGHAYRIFRRTVRVRPRFAAARPRRGNHQHQLVLVMPSELRRRPATRLDHGFGAGLTPQHLNDLSYDRDSDLSALPILSSIVTACRAVTNSISL